MIARAVARPPRDAPIYPLLVVFKIMRRLMDLL